MPWLAHRGGDPGASCWWWWWWLGCLAVAGVHLLSHGTVAWWMHSLVLAVLVRVLKG
ncbi:hypothetical protein E2C01_100681 [Portunus trituberculatus]|uniref:Uncharacterized protein n=1 Tax=Portunus trituberculatus TaxID=210409 RepID=A0A5B7KDN1_PORTR|nr:hypothetical protein [Portunus trituberculatus]